MVVLCAVDEAVLDVITLETGDMVVILVELLEPTEEFVCVGSVAGPLEVGVE